MFSNSGRMPMPTRGKPPVPSQGKPPIPSEKPPIPEKPPVEEPPVEGPPAEEPPAEEAVDLLAGGGLEEIADRHGLPPDVVNAIAQDILDLMVAKLGLGGE